MSSSVQFPIKKAFLYSLIASVILSAVLGIMAILSGRFGWMEVRIILTTVTISLASICGLACGACLGAKAARLLPTCGIALTIIAAGMIIFGMWTEMESEFYWKLAASIAVFAVACAHLSLLSMARMAEWFQWSLIAATVIILGVASLIVGMIHFEIHQTNMFQLLGVAAIVDAAITVLIPIFHKLSKHELARTSSAMHAKSLDPIDEEIATLKQRIADLEVKKRARSLI